MSTVDVTNISSATYILWCGAHNSTGARLSTPSSADVQAQSCWVWRDAVQMKELLAKGLIEPGSSPFTSMSEKRYPLPRIDDLFDHLQKCSLLHLFDLTGAYHQICINDDDIPTINSKRLLECLNLKAEVLAWLMPLLPFRCSWVTSIPVWLCSCLCRYVRIPGWHSCLQ